MDEPAYLLDSNILIYLLQGRSAAVRRRMEACRPGTVVTSSIVVAEVMRAIDPRDGTQRTAARALLAVVAACSFDVQAAEAFARIPFRRGRLDRLIAAHALALRLVLVTDNEADFADVPGLAVENWTVPA